MVRDPVPLSRAAGRRSRPRRRTVGRSRVGPRGGSARTMEARRGWAPPHQSAQGRLRGVVGPPAQGPAPDRGQLGHRPRAQAARASAGSARPGALWPPGLPSGVGSPSWPRALMQRAERGYSRGRRGGAAAGARRGAAGARSQAWPEVPQPPQPRGTSARSGVGQPRGDRASAYLQGAGSEPMNERVRSARPGGFPGGARPVRSRSPGCRYLAAALLDFSDPMVQSLFPAVRLVLKQDGSTRWAEPGWACEPGPFGWLALFSPADHAEIARRFRRGDRGARPSYPGARASGRRSRSVAGGLRQRDRFPEVAAVMQHDVSARFRRSPVADLRARREPTVAVNDYWRALVRD